MSEKSDSSIPNPFESFQEYSGALFKHLLAATSASNSINQSDLYFYKSSFPDAANKLSEVSNNILEVANNLLKHSSLDSLSPFQDYTSPSDFEGRFGDVVDVLDDLLEKADICLDELSGKLPGKTAVNLQQTAPMVAKVAASNATSSRLEYNLIHAKNIIRPQSKFKDTIDNHSSTPFMIKLKLKPNAKVPLEDILANSSEDGAIHPYEHEIKSLTYPSYLFTSDSPIDPQPWESTSCTWVSTAEELQTVAAKLKQSREIAIDLEHHNYRSYQGFVCLMQISTRDEDFVIDTLELRSDLWILNECFTDPNIVKVLHGADSDIPWLQKDFGLYIVNMFDTYQASKLLEFPSHSLAYLLKTYCSFVADKKYQLADWRIRPLPTEMLSYARSDTHFLLYVYDNLRNELIQKSNPETLNLLHAVLARSQDTALKTYQKEKYDSEYGTGPDGWAAILRKFGRPLNRVQFSVFKALHQWRDQTARDEDESTRYVLPSHMLLSLSERQPTDSAGVLGCCSPIPPLVRLYSANIAFLIQRTKEEALVQIGKAALAPETDMKNVGIHTRFEEDGTHDFRGEVILQSDTAPSQYVPKKTNVTVSLKATPLLFVNMEGRNLDEDEIVDFNKAKIIESSLTNVLDYLVPKVVPLLEEDEQHESNSIVGTTVNSSSPVNPAHEPPSQHLYIPSTERTTKPASEPMIISQMAKKRKLESDSYSPRQSDHDSSVNPSPTASSPKKQKNSQPSSPALSEDSNDKETDTAPNQSNSKGKRKRGGKNKSQQSGNSDDKDINKGSPKQIEPFDYSKAEPVIEFAESGSGIANRKGDGNGGKKKGWNPYQGGGDGPKRSKQRKAGGGRGGRSSTFSMKK